MSEEAAPKPLEETVLLDDFPFFISLGRLDYCGETFAIDGIFSFKVQTGTGFDTGYNDWFVWQVFVVLGAFSGADHYGFHSILGFILGAFGFFLGLIGFLKCLHSKKRLVLTLKTGKTIKTRWGSWDRQETRFKAIEDALNKAIGLQKR